MSDFKSKLPDLKELGSITGKLFNDIKNSVGEIIHDYKQKHADVAEPAKTTETKADAAADAPVAKTEEETKKTEEQ